MCLSCSMDAVSSLFFSNKYFEAFTEKLDLNWDYQTDSIDHLADFWRQFLLLDVN